MNNSEADQIYSSEQNRFQSFASLSIFSSLTRRQLALAGFHYRNETISCPSCGVSIDIDDLDVDKEYESNYFRKLHREKVSQVGIRCSFLLEEIGQNINDLCPSSIDNQTISWITAEEPEYGTYEERLKTFSSWPYQNNGGTESYVTPEIMVECGFFYSGPRDGVTCFNCGNILIDWAALIGSKNENIVQLEHARFFPNCAFITSLVGAKYIASAGYFHAVSTKERAQRNPMSQPIIPILYPLVSVPLHEIPIPKSVEDCILTYNDWPPNAPLQAKALAQAGFFYLGDDLKVQCYKCGLIVADWRPGMTAIGTHRKRMEYNCEFIQAIDSTRDANIQSVNEKWRLETLTGYSFDFAKSSSSRLTTMNFDEQENKRTNNSEIDKRLCRELAACGFHRVQNKRIIRCAFCGVTIEPKPNQSIMSQHRANVKQMALPTEKQDNLLTPSQYYSSADCIMLRCQCAANIPIAHREMFPEYPKYQSIFDRITTFQEKNLETLFGFEIRDIADAGFFLDVEKHLRCFQCGNSLPINGKRKREKYAEYNIQQLHAHFYPTCEYIKELLGAKYIAQVLHDFHRSSSSRTHSSLSTQSSDILSPSSSEVFSSLMSPTTTTKTNDNKSPRPLFDGPYNSDFTDDSSDDGYDTTVPAPPTSAAIEPHLRSPRPMSQSPSATTMEPSQCLERFVSPTILLAPNSEENATNFMINPMIAAVQNQQTPRIRNDDSLSDNIGDISPSPQSSPVDVRLLLCHEKNRRDTFKKHNLKKFADVSIECLAYCGFYLNGEGTALLCPCCEVKVTENDFKYFMNHGDGTGTDGEKWTPMHVHRHTSGQLIDQNRPWCTLVQRESFGIYANVALEDSRMKYPEYPTYESFESRIKTYTSGWIYPGGTRLSKELMASAGFFYLGKETCVACYYCGNKLKKFEPRDDPFEEHACFFPFCDYIQQQRGIHFIRRIVMEANRIPEAKLKMETVDGKAIKHIVWDKSRSTSSKRRRAPVMKPNQHNMKVEPSLSIQPEDINDCCVLCSTNPSTHEYDCGHCQICGECFAKLHGTQLEQCLHCCRKATIRPRLITPKLTSSTSQI
ncbi:unnamed protein product [Didymodactylos carnosus]|uniref:Uncharacterized protein n=1 Tax=Didymodactylos carnosus TaxID=1234261 RepID=A0A813ZUE2_9BILA|nr:unnamed protein product [Didymodactylos carnosus]CAF3686558.1 unnamed protein product [Didymodactylos carnosus]